MAKELLPKNYNIHQLHIHVKAPPCALPPPPSAAATSPARKPSTLMPILTGFHAGYFRISLSLCSQALLWKILSSPSTDPRGLRPLVRAFPSFTFLILWSLALLSLLLLSLLFLVRCALRPRSLRAELSHPIGKNYFFAPFAASLLLIQSTPFLPPHSTPYITLCCLLSLPILLLDVKIYGSWLTHGKKFLSLAANPTSYVSVVANLVGARGLAEMGWREAATCMFALGMSHYLVLFVTLYQRVVGGRALPAMLRPAFFLFFAAPSMASLAWDSIAGGFNTSCKMLFFLSLFLFASLVSRPALFRRSMRKFNVAWWAYSFPLTVLALASIEYAQEMKSSWLPNALMLMLSVLSVGVTLVLLAFTAIRPTHLLPHEDPFLSSSSAPPSLPLSAVES